MATESLMRTVESRKSQKWHSSMDAATFGSTLKSMAADELGFRHHKDRGDAMPNRSGSAPPSMEGSFSAISNLLSQQNPSMQTSSINVRNKVENVQSEEQLCSDPAYLAYYFSNMNLNVRLPPPHITQDNHHLVRHVAGSRTNWRLTSFDDSGNGSFHLSQNALSTHKEDLDDGSLSRQASDALAESSGSGMPVKNTDSLASHNKSLLDRIQEDFPRTPSPVYNQSISSSLATDEHVDSDVHSLSPSPSSSNLSKLQESQESYSERGATSPMAQHHDNTGNLRKDETSIEDPSVRSTGSVGGALGLDHSRMRASNINSNKHQEKQSYGTGVLQHHLSTQQSVPYQLQAVQDHVVSQGITHWQSRMDPHAYPKYSSNGVQPSLQSSGFTPPPLYATTAGYMNSINSFYPNFQPSSVYPAQFGVSGYALGSNYHSQYMPGYPSHGSFPPPFDATLGGSGFSGQTSGVLTGERMPHEGDLQHVSKFYGQHGPMFQPAFVDPLNMQHYPRPLEYSYSASLQYSQLSPRGFVGGQLSQQEYNNTVYTGDQKFLSPTNGTTGIPSPRKVGINVGGYYGSPSTMGSMAFPASPLDSPVLPSSPVGRTHNYGRQGELRYPQGSIRNSGLQSGWQGQRTFNNFEDYRRHSFLEELKSSNGRKFELCDIAGRIAEFSVDQHGSRFIQQKLEYCSVEDRASVFKEVLPHASKLMTDVFGNYVIQKFFEYGSSEQKRELADKLSGQMLPLSLQMYGCRVIQKALEVIEVVQRTQLVHELDGHVLKCVRDQNGNHVIQKCIECIPTERIGFVISSFRGQVATLSTHPYGCRVIQRVLEHCSDELQGQCVVDEILESACDLAQNQYGNYVTQHVLERGKPHERSQIISKLIGKVVQLSQHKYASNVIEKCLEHGGVAERELMIDEIIGQLEENDNLLPMMKDQFANYVIQKVLETSNDEQKKTLLNLIKVHLDALKKYTYGKHIVVRFEQLSDGQNLEIG